MMKVKIAEIPFVLQYERKKSSSKMVASITTIGYLVLTLKYVYPWGEQAKRWKVKIQKLHEEGKIKAP
jgi:hypothetical protein